MVRALGFLSVLFGVWLLWSGHTEPLILAFGAGSCLLVVALCLRMRIIDEEGQPFGITIRLLLYIPWLLKEIVVSNFIVAFKILSPRMRLDPGIVEVKPSQKTDLGRVIFANSITLTPGTLSIEAEKKAIIVHVIDKAMMEPEEGTMDRLCTWVEGKS